MKTPTERQSVELILAHDLVVKTNQTQAVKEDAGVFGSNRYSA